MKNKVFFHLNFKINIYLIHYLMQKLLLNVPELTMYHELAVNSCIQLIQNHNFYYNCIEIKLNTGQRTLVLFVSYCLVFFPQ